MDKTMSKVKRNREKPTVRIRDDVAVSDAKFLATIDKFLAKHPGVTVTQLCRGSNGDPSFIAAIRKGRSPTLRTVSAVLSWMKDYEETHADQSAAGSAG